MLSPDERIALLHFALSEVEKDGDVCSRSLNLSSHRERLEKMGLVESDPEVYSRLLKCASMRIYNAAAAAEFLRS